MAVLGEGSVLTHAPVVLLRAEEAVENDDGRSIFSEAFEATVRPNRWLVEVICDFDARA